MLIQATLLKEQTGSGLVKWRLQTHFAVDRFVRTRIDVPPNGGGEHDERAVLKRTLEAAAHVPVPSALHGTRREPPAPSGLARITRSISSDSIPRSTISRFSSISFRWQKYLRASLIIVANTPATDPIRTINATILKGTGSDAMDSKKLFMTLVPDQKMAMSRQDCTTIPRSSGCEADLAGNIRRHEEILGSDVLERSHVTRATGIGRATITNILSGRREISKGNVSKLARYFSVDPSVFLAEA